MSATKAKTRPRVEERSGTRVKRHPVLRVEATPTSTSAQMEQHESDETYLMQKAFCLDLGLGD